jgi:hypothetical protein
VGAAAPRQARHVFSQPSLSLPGGGDCAPGSATAKPIRTGLLRFAAFEIAVWAALYGAYLAVRGATIGDQGKALANGRHIAAAERALGLFHEVQVQHALAALHGLFSAYYMAGFAPVVAATLVWLAIRQPLQYRDLRTALLVSLSLATVVFIVFPAAPPRLIPNLGIIDTVGLGGHDTGSFAGVRFNPYAAMPSMHVGWSLLVGLAGFRAARRRLVRALFAVHPLVMALTVTATGNHFALDAIAGATIALVVAWLVFLSRRRPSAAGVSTTTPSEEAEMIVNESNRNSALQRGSIRNERSGQILIRRSRENDTTSLRRLAELDSRTLPAGSFLLAEVADDLVAAVPLDTRAEPISNPFQPTADIVELLRLHARQLRRSTFGAQPIEVSA